MKNTFLKWTTLSIAILFVTLNSFSRDVTFQGVATGWASNNGVTFVNVGSASSKKIDCLNASNVSYLTLNGAGKYIQFSLDDVTEKIDGITIIWLAAADNQVLPILFGEGITAPDASIISTVTNGGIALTPPIATSGGSNCPAGSTITFPISAKANTIMLSRTMSVEATTVVDNIYPTMSARISTPSGTLSQQFGTGSTPAIGQIILHISNLQAKITEFKIDNTYNGTIDQVNKTISVTLPYAYYNTNITSLTPSFVNSGTFVTPNPTNPADFTNPVSYILQNNALEQVTYTVTVTRGPASTACNITGFSIPNQIGTAEFKAASGPAKDSIIVTMPYSTTALQIQSLVPTYTTSPLVSSSIPNTGVAQDFTSPVSYIVTAQDGTTTKEYVVRVKKAPASTAAFITNFSLGIANEQVLINHASSTITVTVAGASDISSITPTIAYSSLSSHTEPPFPADFGVAQIINVLAEDGVTTKTYTINVIKDNTNPTVTSSTPADASSDYSLAGQITIVFDEDVVIGTGGVTLSGGTISATPTSISGSTVKYTFSGLTSVSPYSITIPAGAFSDIYGNPSNAKTINFTTADGVNQILPYASHMEGASFSRPAFISGGTYMDSADVKATTSTQYGAYKLAPGAKLTITTSKVDSVCISVYAPGENRYFSITNNKTLDVTTGSFSNYDNNGMELIQKISKNETTEIYVNNDITSTGDIYISYIYISDMNEPALTERQQWCK